MKQKELIEFTQQELLQEEKKRKSNQIAGSLIVGIMIGIAIYRTVNNGFGFFTFFPLFFLPIAISAGTNYNAVKKEIKSRETK